MEKITRILDNQNINAMLKALRKVKVFTIDKTNNKVVVSHKKVGEVLRGLRSPSGWLTRYNKNLFSN